jgi:8-amino-7-oxononanoate synthase
MVGSNNYLGLTHDPRVKEAAIEATRRYGTSCTGSRLLNGNLDLHERLEHELAGFVGKESAVVFSTGFFANQGTFEALVNKEDLIFSDAHNHASIISGCRLSRAQIRKFAHNNMNSLAEALETTRDSDDGRIVITDGVFSMTGDILDLPGLVKITESFPGDRVRIMIDDAHALGVLGAGGRGTASHFGLTHKVDLIMSTFSKSLASIGGFVAGHSTVIDFIKNTSRSLIFTAAIPAGSAAASLKALEIIKTEPERIAQLWKNAELARAGLKSINVDTLHSTTPIIPIFVGHEGKALKIVVELYQRGLFATAIIFPAVPYGNALIRTSFMASHTERDIAKVVDVMRDIAKKYDLPHPDPSREFVAHGNNCNFQHLGKYDLVKAAVKSHIKSTANRLASR